MNTVIKADLNRLRTLCDYFEEKAEECTQLCNQINSEYNRVSWYGADKHFLDMFSDYMRIMEMKAALKDLKDYTNKVRDWIRIVEMYQGIMKGLISRLE